MQRSLRNFMSSALNPQRCSLVRIVLVLAFATHQLGCDCTTADCDDNLSVGGETFVALRPTGDVRALVCRGDFCESASFSLDDAGSFAVLDGQLVGSAGASVSTTEREVFHVEFGASITPGGDAGGFGAQERVLVEFTRPDGTRLGLADQVVELEKVRPNGQGCPPTCAAARVDIDIEL